MWLFPVLLPPGLLVPALLPHRQFFRRGLRDAGSDVRFETRVYLCACYSIWQERGHAVSTLSTPYILFGALASHGLVRTGTSGCAQPAGAVLAGPSVAHAASVACSTCHSFFLCDPHPSVKRCHVAVICCLRTALMGLRRLMAASVGTVLVLRFPRG